MVHDFLHRCSAFSTFIGFWCFSLYILHVLLSLSQQVCNVNDTVCHLPGPLFMFMLLVTLIAFVNSII